MKTKLFYLGLVFLALNFISCTESSIDELEHEELQKRIDGDEIEEDDV